MKREALAPTDDELFGQIGEQQQRVLQRFPAGAPVLFPRQNGNLNGRKPISSHTYRSALDRWLEACDIRDEHGQPVHLTPHQWRHTLGTVLQPRCPAARRPENTRPRLASHDRSLCAAVR
jgi:integrase